MNPRVIRALEIVLFPVLWITKTLLSIPSWPISAVWWKRIGLAVLSGSLGFLVWSRFNVPHGTLTGTWSGDFMSYPFLALVAVYGVAYTFLPIAIDALGIATLHRIARILPILGHGTLAVTRHTLESRQSDSRKSYWNRKYEMGALVATAIVASAIVSGFTIDRAVAHQTDALAFTALVVAPDAGNSASTPPIGVDRNALRPAVITALEADPNLAVVPYGQVTVGPTNGATPTAAIMLVSPADLDRVTPAGARPIGLQDGVMLSPDPESESLTFPAPRQVIDVSTGTVEATVLNRSWSGPLTLATRSWGEAAWGDVPAVGALVAYVGKDLPAEAQFSYVADAARLAGADTRPAPTLSPEVLSMLRSVDTFARGFAGVMSVLMLSVACIATVVFSVRTVRKHRQVRATVAALGATPRALALAVPIDAGITLAIAFALGTPIGVAAAAIAKVPTLFTLGAPLDVGTTGWAIGWNLSHIGWGLVAAVAGATWLLAVAATTVYGFRAARRTPVDELRVAIKEGAV